jgi:ribosomal protein S28E/S33
MLTAKELRALEAQHPGRIIVKLVHVPLRVEAILTFPADKAEALKAVIIAPEVHGAELVYTGEGAA